MSCPRCNSEKIVKGGYYITKKFRLRQRYRCTKCGRNFVVGNLNFISVAKERKIIELSRKTNPFISKFDNRKSDKYSMREISRITSTSIQTVSQVLNKKWRKKL